MALVILGSTLLVRKGGRGHGDERIVLGSNGSGISSRIPISVHLDSGSVKQLIFKSLIRTSIKNHRKTAASEDMSLFDSAWLCRVGTWGPRNPGRSKPVYIPYTRPRCQGSYPTGSASTLLPSPSSS